MIDTKYALVSIIQTKQSMGNALKCIMVGNLMHVAINWIKNLFHFRFQYTYDTSCPHMYRSIHAIDVGMYIGMHFCCIRLFIPPYNF
jgi:hypothetical protein